MRQESETSGKFASAGSPGRGLARFLIARLRHGKCVMHRNFPDFFYSQKIFFKIQNFFRKTFSGIVYKIFFRSTAKKNSRTFHYTIPAPGPVNPPQVLLPIHLSLRRKHSIARCLTIPPHQILRRETGIPDQFRQPVATSGTWWHPPIGPQNTAMGIFLLGDLSRGPGKTGKSGFLGDRPLELC